jgi:hypothetical protein
MASTDNPEPNDDCVLSEIRLVYFVGHQPDLGRHCVDPQQQSMSTTRLSPLTLSKLVRKTLAEEN